MKTTIKQSPALFLGIHILVGVSLRLSPWVLLPVVVFWFFAGWRQALAGLAIVAAAWCYALASYSLPAETVTGRGVLRIEEVAKRGDRFGRRWVVAGRLRTFEGFHDVPVRIFLTKKWERLRADRDYVVTGTLRRRPRGYVLKVDPDVPWEEVVGSWSIAEHRFHLKQAVTAYLQDRFKSRKTGAFAAGLITGDFAEPTLLLDFGRLGLSHLMAISGFHFSLIAMMLGFLLRPLLRPRVGAILLVVLLSAYFLFVGYSPSVQRAWVMAVALFLGWALGRRCTPLNALGVALMVVLLWDPQAVGSIGFQFSFFCTAAILLFYRPFERGLRRFFTWHPFRRVVKMEGADQHGYVVVTAVRHAVALTLAVNVVALPLTLYHFGQFPLLSLLFNLFFPLLITVAMVLIAAGIVIPALFVAAEAVLGFAIDMTRSVPPALEFHLTSPPVPLWFLMGGVALLVLALGGYARSRHLRIVR